ncbi:MAG: hypothetical protein EB101_00415 [Chitinophagia bacterium]|nr:hypothetical protein [Chitinophagia bacterium]
MPRLVEEPVVEATPEASPVTSEETIVHFELSATSELQPEAEPAVSALQPATEPAVSPVRSAAIVETDASYLAAAATPASTGPAAGGYLTKPSTIYAEAPPSVPLVQQAPLQTVEPIEASAPTAVPTTAPTAAPVTEPEELQMQLIEKDELPAAATPLLYEIHTATPTLQEEGIDAADTIEQQRRAADRLQKLRNLSYNVNAADPNNEFETVPAYIRRNMELYNSSSQIENFYSSYEVKDDPAKQGPISTLNTFLDGKKPD